MWIANTIFCLVTHSKHGGLRQFLFLPLRFLHFNTECLASMFAFVCVCVVLAPRRCESQYFVVLRLFAEYGILKSQIGPGTKVHSIFLCTDFHS